jgi:hypothetical protein
MSEQVEKKPLIDTGVVAKVVWQAQKALKEQFGEQGVQDWNKATDEERSDLLEAVSDYLEDKGKFKESRLEKSPAFDLTCAIIDALLPKPELDAEKPAKKKAEKKN